MALKLWEVGRVVSSQPEMERTGRLWDLIPVTSSFQTQEWHGMAHIFCQRVTLGAKIPLPEGQKASVRWFRLEVSFQVNEPLQIGQSGTN